MFFFIIFRKYWNIDKRKIIGSRRPQKEKQNITKRLTCKQTACIKYYPVGTVAAIYDSAKVNTIQRRTLMPGYLRINQSIYYHIEKLRSLTIEQRTVDESRTDNLCLHD